MSARAFISYGYSVGSLPFEVDDEIEQVYPYGAGVEVAVSIKS